ncbi:hypothetical protein Tco_0287487 [Tanacetum coccineum]
MTKSTSRIDPAWEFSLLEDPNNTTAITCTFCGKKTHGGIFRQKLHLLGTSTAVLACLKVSDEAKEKIRAYMEDKRKKKVYYDTPMDHDNLNEIDDDDEDTNEQETKGKRPGIEHQSVVADAFDKERRAKTIQYIARFFYQAGIPFNAARLDSFKKEIDYTNGLLQNHKEEWKKDGCSIMSDAWSDIKGRSIITFLVNSPAGTMFIKSVDAFSYMHTADKLFDLLDAFIEEIGEANVVQVVTDNGANYVAAGKLLEVKRPNLYWTPCAAHCIDLMLEDIGKIPKLWGLGPLVKVLRHVDGEQKPSMGYIYEAMNRAKKAIEEGFKFNSSKYERINQIIDNRWESQLHRPLHAAGHLLNPEYFYDSPEIEFNKEIMTLFWKCSKEGKVSCLMVDFVWELSSKSTTICYQDDVDESNEWLTGSNDAEGEFVFGEDEALTWGTLASASGVNEPRPYTRRNASASTSRTSTSRTLYDESDADLVDEDDLVDLGNDGEIRNENLDDYSE